MNVVVARAGALGDVLLLRAALASLRAADHRVTLVAPGGPAQLLAGEVDAVRDWEGPAVRSLLAGSVDDWPRYDGALLVTRSPDVLGAFGSIADEVLPADPLPSGEPAWLAYCRPVLDRGIRLAEPPVLRCPRSPAARALLDALPASFLSVHPGSGSPSKNWPGFTALVDRLAPAGFLLVEGPADDTAAAPLRERTGVVVARGLALPDLAAVVGHAAVHVGNDSGIGHLAAACGVPCVLVFGPTDPAVWAPAGARIVTLHDRSGRWTDVDPADVAAAVAALR